MKTLIQIVLVALVMGGLSAAGATYWKQWFAPAASANPSVDMGAVPNADAEMDGHSSNPEPLPSDVNDHAAETASIEPSKPTPTTHKEEMEQTAEPVYVPPVAVRPPYVVEGDEAGQLITALRERARAVEDAERSMAERQAALKLIFDDLRSEQLNAAKLRQRILEEMGESSRLVDESLQSQRADDAALRAARDEQESLRKQLDALRQSADEQERLKKQLESQHQAAEPTNNAADTSGSLEENTNLKKLAAVYDTMPPENTAKVFQQLVKSNRTAAVVSLLNAMKERQTAKVLALVSDTDPSLAADLTERLKRLKTSPAPQALQ